MSPGFAKIAWLGAVRRCTDIPAAQRLVIEHIGDTADRNGVGARMSTDRVMEELGVSEDTVSRGRTAAERHGLWVVVSKPRRGRPPTEGGAARAAEYRLAMPDNYRNGAPINGDNYRNGAPINGDNYRKSVPKIPQKCPENTAPLRTPSGLSSGSSSGVRGARASDEPLDGAAVPGQGNDARTQTSLASNNNNRPPVDGNSKADERKTAAATAGPPTPEYGPFDYPDDDPDVAHRLVADLIAGYPRSIGDRLRREVTGLRAEEFADDVIADALRKWRDRPDAKPGLLPYLVADVVKERLATGNAAPEPHTALPPTEPKPAWQCNKCRDGGLVLTTDGSTLASGPLICHCRTIRNGGWHEATPEELRQLNRKTNAPKGIRDEWAG